MTGHKTAFLISLLLITGTAAAQSETEPVSTPEIVAAEIQTTGTEDPRMVEIRGVLDKERRDVADLVAVLNRTVDHAERLALQMNIAEVKKNAEVDMLKVQLKYALSENKDDAVARLEASIESILNPVVRLAPEQRPATDEAGARR